MELKPKTPWDLGDGIAPTPLEGETEADLCIVGGGFTGLALAYHLKRFASQREIVLLEADRIGAGASGRTGGILMNGTSSDDYPGTDRVVEAIRKTIEEERIDCQLRLGGCMELERDDHAEGPPLWTDGGRLAPVNAVPGGDFHPILYLEGLKKAALARGVRIYEKSAVQELSTDGAICLRTAAGSVSADRVVFSTNTQFLKPLRIQTHFTPYNTYALATGRLSPDILAEIGWKQELPFYTLSLPFLWGRTTPDHRIVIGSGLSRLGRIKAEMLEELEERFHSLHPALEKVPVEFRWWGPILIPHDWTPKILASPVDPRVMFVGGYAGHGCALSHLFGEKTAAFLAGDETALDEFAWARTVNVSLLDRTVGKIALKVASNYFS